MTFPDFHADGYTGGKLAAVLKLRPINNWTMNTMTYSALVTKFQLFVQSP